MKKIKTEKLFYKVTSNIKNFQLLRDSKKIILAVSGGIDSVVLLDIFFRLRNGKNFPDFVVAHFNHYLRGNDSDLDQKFVRSLAKKYGYIFETSKKDIRKIQKEKKGNLEEVAREERYKFLFNLAKKYKTNKVITAHHADDQVETVLLNYLRGAEFQGLSGMDFISRLTANGKQLLVVRPMLNIWRKDIERYIFKNNLLFREDITNLDTKILRNNLRINIIPFFEKKDPKFKKNIWEKSRKIKKLICKTDLGVDEIYKKISLKKASKAVELNGHCFEKLKDGFKTEIFKKAFKEVKGDLKDIEKKHIISSLKLINSRKAGKTVELPGSLKIMLDYEGILIFKGKLSKIKIKRKKLNIGFNKIKEIGLTVELSISKKSKRVTPFEYEKIGFPLYVRSFLPGDKIKIETGTKKIQDLFTDLKISKYLRSMVPVITDKNGAIICVLGIRKSKGWNINSKNNTILNVNFKKIR